ncbi:MAG: fused MFS/spermidine synthase [Gammaproteobacteria bacterium]
MLTLCFLLSGFAALVYQTAWTREFALVFGTSELAVATVLAAYMGGLALGAWIVERWLPRISRPVLAYAGLELGIGVSAVVLVPALLMASDWLLRTMLGEMPGPPDSARAATSLFYLLSAFVVLAIPTVLMGATLPLLARHVVRSERDIGQQIGFLYSMNAAGAVGGALFTAFWLLPHLGLRKSIGVAAFVNVVIFALAAIVARRTAAQPLAPAICTTSHGGIASRPHPVPDVLWILPLMFVSGAVSFFHEVLWTRMLSHVLGSSLHAFGVMVASFLAGIALGSGVGALLARRRGRAVQFFAVGQLGCALAAVGAYLLMDRFIPPPQRLAATASFAVLILLPLTFFIGTTFPLAVRILANGTDDAASASARVYAWNTFGAIVGSLAAGFVVIPWLRFEGSIQVAVFASCALAVAAACMLVRAVPAFAVAVVIAALAISVSFRPSAPERLLRTSPMNIADDGAMVFYDVGRSDSIVVLEQDGGLVLRTNGLPEAMMETPGMPPRFSGEFWLSPLAVIARPDVQSMLVVGYGGGVAVEAVPPSVRSLDVIELEPAMIAANRATARLRKRNPLLDPRLTLISNDARGALNLTSRRYDAIVSQPSHPWTAGASHLYTLEFMRQAREHLTDGGVFVQWMNVAFLDEALLRSLTATLLEAFGNVRLYRPDPNTLLFLASSTPLDVEAALAASGRPLRDSPAHYGRLGINTIEDLFAALAVDSAGARALAAGAKKITDDDNRIATSSVYDFGQGLDAQGIGRILAPYDPLQDPHSWVYRNFRDRLSFAYIARRIAMFTTADGSTHERIAAMARALEGSEVAGAVNAVLLHAQRQPEGEGAALVMRGNQLISANDWKAVSELDPLLAQVAWTDSWKLDAVQMRADWRGHVTSRSTRRDAANECIDLIDDAVVALPSLALYGLRARCGVAAARSDVLVESLWSLGNGTYNNARNLSAGKRLAARQNLEILITALQKNLPATPEGAFDAARRDEVVQKLRAHIARLE